MQVLKSIACVVGSYALSIVLVLLTDPLLHALFPNGYVADKPVATPLLIVSTALFVVIAVFCAWVCARTAPGRASMHVLWFFILGEVLGLATTIPNWGKMPSWYFISWLVLWIPAVWAGYKLARR